jgi:hypothetical protein
MQDLIFLGVFAGFVLLALGYVRLCERIVGSPDRGGE